jgi:hypothetical protein
MRREVDRCVSRRGGSMRRVVRVRGRSGGRFVRDGASERSHLESVVRIEAGVRGRSSGRSDAWSRGRGRSIDDWFRRRVRRRRRR